MKTVAYIISRAMVGDNLQWHSEPGALKNTPLVKREDIKKPTEKQLLDLMAQHLDWYPQYGIQGKDKLAKAILKLL